MNNVTSSPGLQGTLPLYSSPANLGVQSMATVPGAAVYSTPIQHGAAGGAVTCADRSDFSTFPSSIGNGKNLLCSWFNVLPSPHDNSMQPTNIVVGWSVLTNLPYQLWLTY